MEKYRGYFLLTFPHFIWKKYVLNWYFDMKSWIVDTTKQLLGIKISVKENNYFQLQYRHLEW